MPEDLTPILIGAGQFTQRESDPAAAKSPMDMMVETAARAARDAGADRSLLTRIDSLAVVNILSWPYNNAPRLLAERLDAHPAEELYTTIGGNTPQWLVNETAAKIAAGQVGLALVAGADTVGTVRRAQRAGIKLDWDTGADDEAAVVGDPRLGAGDHEVAHGLALPIHIYPLFENALRAHYRRSIRTHSRWLGDLCSRFSAVAAENPHAWSRGTRTAEEIRTVTRENRLIGFPYPKFMNAFIDVDQSACLLMTSVARARALGIDASRWVYLLGTGDAQDHWFVSDRVNYHSSPAIKLAGEKALATAGLGIDDIDYFDLYSCFPCAVQIARDMLGIGADDPRPLTVTGGLPYHGGPGNNYTTHGIASLMEKVRARPGSRGLATGLGWYITKHSMGIYCAEPPERAWSRETPATYQAELDRMPRPEFTAAPEGRATIETYTVLYDREGRPEKGIVIGRLQDGRRFLANTPEDRSTLEALTTEEGIGRAGVVSTSDGLNRFAPA